MPKSKIPSVAWAHIRLFAMDVDGILTDGTVRIASDGTESKSFSILDGMGLVLGACLTTLVRNVSQRKPSRREHLITAILLYTLIVLGSGGVILVGGFPPMIVALILISLIVLLHDQEYLRSKTLLQIALTGILALTYSTVALPIVAAISIVKVPVLLRLFKTGRKNDLALLTVFGLGAILLTYAIFLPTAHAWGWNQVLDLGGIPYFPIYLAVLTAAIAMWLLILSFRSDDRNFFYPLVLVFVWISYLVLAIITHHYNHEITYYAHKQAYIATVLTIPGAIILVRRLCVNKQRFFMLASLVLVASGFLIQIGTTFKFVPIALRIVPGHEFQRINGDQILKVLNETKSPIYVLVNTNTNTDLNSRWINGLNNTWTDAALSIFYEPIETWPNYPEKLTPFTNLSPPPVLVTDDISNVPEQTRVFLTNAGWKILIEPRS